MTHQVFMCYQRLHNPLHCRTCFTQWHKSFLYDKECACARIPVLCKLLTAQTQPHLNGTKPCLMFLLLQFHLCFSLLRRESREKGRRESPLEKPAKVWTCFVLLQGIIEQLFNPPSAAAFENRERIVWMVWNNTRWLSLHQLYFNLGSVSVTQSLLVVKAHVIWTHVRPVSK